MDMGGVWIYGIVEEERGSMTVISKGGVWSRYCKTGGVRKLEGSGSIRERSRGGTVSRRGVT